MAAEDILGISASMDISDIDKSINELDVLLDSIGEKASNAGQKMEESLSKLDLSKIQQQIKAAENELQSIVNVIKANTQEISDFQEKINAAKDAISKGGDKSQLTEQITEYKEAISAIQNNSKELIAEHDQLQGSLTSLVTKYNMVAQAANAGQTASTAMTGASAAAHAATATAVVTEAASHTENASRIGDETARTLENIETKKSLKEELKLLQEGFADINKELEKYADNTAIQKQEEAVRKAAENIEKYKQALEKGDADAGTLGSQQYMNNLQKSYDRQVEKLKQMKHEMERLKADQAEYSDAIRQTQQKIDDTTKSHTKASDAAKKAKEETKGIGEEADKAAKKVGGIFSKFKSALGGAMKGDFTALFGMLGKLGMYGAVAAAVGKSIQWLSQQSQALNESMLGLKGYLDSGVLEDLRQQYVQLEYDSSHSAEEMAAAGTRWVKYFKNIRDNADAISDVTKSSNDLATVIGSSSEKAAEYILKIAGAYHQSASEAKENSTIIINASKNSTAKYEEIAQAISSTANRAQNAGISLRELASATAYGAITFGSASEAASAYVMMMTRLSSQSKNEYNPSVVGATKALQNLAKSSDMNNTLTSLLGKRQASLAKVFVQGAADIDKQKKSLDSQAAAAKTVSAMEGKVENQEKRLENAKKALAQEINMNLTPAYTNFLNSCVLVIKGIGSVATQIKSSLNPVLKAIENAIDWINKKAGSGIVGKLLQGTSSTWAFLASPSMGVTKLLMDSQNKNDGRQKSLEKLFNDNLKKYGSSSPGKAYLQSVKAITSSTGRYSKSDVQYLAKLMYRTRAENNAKVTGENFSLGNQNAITDKNKNKEAKKLAEQQRKYNETQAEQEAKQLSEQKKVEWELYVAEQEKGITMMHEGNQKELAQRKLDFEKKKHEIEEEAESLRQKNIAAEKAQYEKNPSNKKRAGFYASGLDKNVSLTDEQQKLINIKMELLNAQYEEDEKKRVASDLQALYDYLKEYGSVQEQKYAIAKEYDEKISKAQGENQKKLLEAQKKSALSSMDAKSLAMDIDWSASFKQVGYVLKDLAKETLAKVEEYMKTPDFKNLSATDKKSYSDLRKELKDEQGTATSPFKMQTWENIAMYAKAYQDSVKSLINATNEHSKAVDELEKAEKELNTATSATAYEIAKNKVEIAKKKVSATSTTLGNAQQSKDNAQQNLTDSTDEAAQGLENFSKVLSNITSGTLSGFVKGIVGIIQSLSGSSKDLGSAFGELGGKIGGLVGAILSIIEALGDDPSSFIDQLLSKIINVIDGVLSQLVSGKLIETLLKDIGKLILTLIKDLVFNTTASALKTSTFGLIDPDSWFSGNGKKVQEAINNLTESNERLQKSIDKLKDTMTNSYGQESTKAYKEALQQQKTYNANVMEKAKQQMSYWGAHGSWNHYWKGFSSDELKYIKENVSDSFNGDITTLTPEEMKKLLSNQDFVDKIRGTGAKYKGRSKYGEDVLQKLEDYADLAGNLEELTEQWRESITQISFDSMKDNFISNLMDMSKSASDFADDFAEQMQKALLTYSMEDLINGDLKKLYQEWAELMDEKNGAFSEKDVEDFQKKYQQIVDEGLKRRDEWAKVTGYTGESSQSQQTATGKGIEAITADQASSLIGIGYAMQIALEQGNEVRKAISVDVSSLRVYAETIGNNISEMRDIQYQGLEQLQAINKNTAPISTIQEDIANMYKIMKERY